MGHINISLGETTGVFSSLIRNYLGQKKVPVGLSLD